MNPLATFNKLFDPFPGNLKKELPGGKGTYVEWHQYVMRAQKTFPEGYSKRLRVSEVGGQLVVTCRITCEATGVYQEALGAAEASKTAWGGAIAEAESQAFRRAMANWGLGLEMYMDDDQFRVATLGTNPSDPPEPSDTSDEPVADTPTARQMEVIKVLGALINQHDPDVAQIHRDYATAGTLTKTRAGILVRAMRESMGAMGLEDPTKAED